jgi:magnesium transporter
MGEIVDCALYRDGHLVRGLELAEVTAALHGVDPGVFVWVDVREPDPALMTALSEAFTLHELAVEDALRAHQRPKLEDYGDMHFLVLRTAIWCEEEKRVELGEMHLLIGPRYLVSIRHGAGGEPRHARRDGAAHPERLRDGPLGILYALIDAVVDGYFPVVDALEDEVDGLEEALFAASAGADLSRHLYGLHAEIARFRRAVAPLLDALDRIVRNERLVGDRARPYYRDVHDHVLRITERIDHIRDLVASAVETNYALVSVRQNEIMKRLAAYAALVAVPTMVAGLYGMNFRDLPGVESSLALWAVLGATVAACAFLWRRFRRMDWL